MESFFSFVDRSVEHCNGVHLRNRLELARSKMNHLHKFLMEFSPETRLAIVSKAYSNAPSNRDDIILEENMLLGKRTVTLMADEEKVVSYLYKLIKSQFCNPSTVINMIDSGIPRIVSH